MMTLSRVKAERRGGGGNMMVVVGGRGRRGGENRMRRKRRSVRVDACRWLGAGAGAPRRLRKPTTTTTTTVGGSRKSCGVVTASSSNSSSSERQESEGGNEVEVFTSQDGVEVSELSQRVSGAATEAVSTSMSASSVNSSAGSGGVEPQRDVSNGGGGGVKGDDENEETKTNGSGGKNDMSVRAKRLGMVSRSGRGLIQFMGAWETLEAQLEEYSMDVRPVLRSLKLLVQLLAEDSELKQEKLDNSIEGALLLATLGADVHTICACLLRTTAGGNIEATKRVEAEVGSEVAQQVHNAWRINDVSRRAPELSDKVTDELRRYILSFCDVRAVRVELATQLASMRRISKRERWEQIREALCVLQLYVPLANALQVETIISSELLDRSFQVIFPGSFSNVAAWLSRQSDELESVLAHAQVEVRRAINADEQLKSMVSSVHIIGRTKGLLSTMRKLTANGKTLSQVYDLIGLRIVLDDLEGADRDGKTEAEIEALTTFGCYRVQGIVHDAFSHVKGRMKDYIARPKENGYRSLHSTILVARDFLGAGADPADSEYAGTFQPVEIQVRTRKMDTLAEHGAAAHSAYKGNVTEPIQVRQLQQVLQEASIAISGETDEENEYEASEIDRVFSLLDLNNDGEISRTELLMLVSELDDSHGDAETVDEAVRELFAAADENRDGKISLEEFRAFRRRLSFESAVKSLDTEVEAIPPPPAAMQVELEEETVSLVEEVEDVEVRQVVEVCEEEVTVETESSTPIGPSSFTGDVSLDVLQERLGRRYSSDDDDEDEEVIGTCAVDDNPLNTIIAEEEEATAASAGDLSSSSSLAGDAAAVEEFPFGSFTSIFKSGRARARSSFLNPTIMRLSDFMPRMPGMPSLSGRRGIDLKTWRLLPAQMNSPEEAARVASASLDPGGWQSTGDSWLARPITIKPRSSVVVGAEISEVDYVIPLPTVSGKHARLFKQGSSLYIQDLGSTNGTWVDKRRVRPGVKFKLISGSEVSFDRDYARFVVTILSPDETGVGARDSEGPEVPGAPIPVEVKAAVDRAWDGMRGGWRGMDVHDVEELKKWDFEDVSRHFETEVSLLKERLSLVDDQEEMDDVLVRLGIMHREWARIATSRGRLLRGEAQALYKTGFSYLKCGQSVACSAEKVHILWRWAGLRAKDRSYMVARILFMDAVSTAKSELGDLTSWGRVGMGALHAWAQMEKGLGYSDNAERLLDCAIREDPCNEYIHHARAVLAIKSRKFKLARQRFLAGVASNPTCTQLWQSWGQLEAERGSLDAARELFISGMRVNPRDVVLLQSWGVAESRGGNPKQAKKLFARALTIDRKNVFALSAWGKVEERLGNIEEAMRLYARGIEIEPHNAHCLQSLARLYTKQRLFEKATPLLDSILERDPENPAVLIERAIIEDKLGNNEGAKQFSIRASRANKRSKRRTNRMSSYLDAEIRRLSGAQAAATETAVLDVVDRRRR